MPRDKGKILDNLYHVYFRAFPTQLRNAYLDEFWRIKELHPDMPESEITKKLFKKEPFSFLPDEIQQEKIGKYPAPMGALNFVERHFDSYRKYFKEKKANEKSEKQP